MTPTLLGRLHTRLFLSVVVGVPITLPFCVLAFPVVPIPLGMLMVVVLVGAALDPAYHLLQQRRWDHDWPLWAQVAAGAVEFLASGAILTVLLGVLSIVYPLAVVPLCLFPIHFGLVWFASFLVASGPMRVVFPNWRFRGGEMGTDRRWR